MHRKMCSRGCASFSEAVTGYLGRFHTLDRSRSAGAEPKRRKTQNRTFALGQPMIQRGNEGNGVVFLIPYQS